MNYQTAIWILFAVLLISLYIVRKKGNKKHNEVIIGLLLFILIAKVFLPRQFFGKWNSISRLNGKNITEILLRPSEPNWEVNLVGKDFVIIDKKQIDSLTGLLQKVEVYFPGHPSQIWETKMIIISSEKDSLEIKIAQTENNGTDIYTQTNEWRKDPIGKYLETITSYRQPVYSDTTMTKF